MKLLSLYQFLQSLIKDLILVDVVIAVLILTGSILFGKIINIFSRIILKPIFKRTKTQLDDKILELINKSDNKIFSVIGLYLGVDYLTNRIKSETGLKKLLSPETYNFLIGTSEFVFNVLFILAVIITIYILSKIFNLSMDYYVEKKNLQNARGSLGDFIPLLRKLVLIILSIIGGLIILNRFNVNISGIIVSLGVGSLAIALAAQETLSNMIAGFVILIDRPFREGDRIRLPSGEFGDVFEIGMRSTKILDFDNNLVIVPNAELVKSRIQNITYPDYVSRVFVDVEIAYDSDLELAKKILIQIAKDHPLTLQEFEPAVFVTGFTSNGVSLRLISRTADYRNVYQMQSDFREAILKKFAENKIEIPYQQIVIRKHNES
jgi:small-conductance mechanosensitive channel